MCLFKFPARPNTFWHWTQGCDFSLLWINMCLFRVPDRPYDFLRSEQMCLIFSLLVSIKLTIPFQFFTDRKHKAPKHVSYWSSWTFLLKYYPHFYFPKVLAEFSIIAISITFYNYLNFLSMKPFPYVMPEKTLKNDQRLNKRLADVKLETVKIIVLRWFCNEEAFISVVDDLWVFVIRIIL